MIFQVKNHKIIHEKAYFKIKNEIKGFEKYLLPSYKKAFVISIHKAQGSEFGNVLLVIPNSQEMCGKELFYTALTRAKKQVSIISDMDYLQKVSLKKSIKTSALNERLNC